MYIYEYVIQNNDRLLAFKLLIYTFFACPFILYSRLMSNYQINDMGIALMFVTLILCFTGGERAARDLELLNDKNIKAVVNCTDDLRWVFFWNYTFWIFLLHWIYLVTLFRNYHTGKMSYYTFNVAWWRKYVGDSEVCVFRRLISISWVCWGDLR